MRIEVTQGQDKGRVFDVAPSEDTVIGRQPDCAVPLTDPEVSRFHARICLRGDRLCVEDMGSANGTIVDGMLAPVSPIHEQSVIIVGHSTLVVSETAVRRPLSGSTLRMREDRSSVIHAVGRKEADLIGTSGVGNAILNEHTALQTICEICRAAAGGADAGAVIEEVLDRTRGILRADGAAVIVPAGDDWRIVAVSVPDSRKESFAVSRSIVQTALKQGMAFLYEDGDTGKAPQPAASVLRQGITSAICAPLSLAGRNAGVLLVDRKQRKMPFDQSDLRFTVTVGNIVAVLLDRQRLEAEALEKTRLATIGETIAGLAHSIKNILFAFRMGIGAQKAYVEARRFDAAQSNIETLSEVEQRISNLVLNMLNYAKDRTPEKAPVEIRKTISSVINLYSPQAQANDVALELLPADHSPSVLGEEPALHHVFVNLVVNALDALRARGENGKKVVRISTEQMADASGESFVLTRVFDNGCGIPQEKLDRVFATFYSTKGARGTGLGLASARKTIAEHGGEITVDSRIGEWTEFRVRLPAAP